jgi:hypothetical protein
MACRKTRSDIWSRKAGPEMSESLAHHKYHVQYMLKLCVMIALVMAVLRVVAVGQALVVMSRSGDAAWSESQFGTVH